MEPSSELYELVAILKDELRLCDEFDAVLAEERRSLERFRPAEVERVSVRKLSLRGRFIELERKRDRLVKRLMTEAGLQEKGTVPLSRFLRTFPAASAVLNPVAGSLRERLERLQRQNGINQAILDKAIAHLKAAAGFFALSLGTPKPAGGRFVSRQV